MGPAVEVELPVTELAGAAFEDCLEEPLSPDEVDRLAEQLQHLRGWLQQSVAQLEAQAQQASGGRLASISGDDLVWQNAIQQRALADRRLMLNEVMRAFERIKEGTFGRCVEDGSAIARSLLEEVPWARYCASCATRHF